MSLAFIKIPTVAAILLCCGTAALASDVAIGPEQRSFWSFQPVKQVSLPAVANETWGHNGIDRFILRRLEANQLTPAAPADKRRLLRRATFDLTGLPPTPGEMQAFLDDESRDAFARVVDRLLNSPRYGERWARHWLDGVRFMSDVGYYNFSDLGWRYRDWVIRALNADMPYDEFVVHQIAGDLLASPTGETPYTDGHIATGVLAMGNFDDQESDKEKLYAEVIDDQIDLVGRQFLGLTVSCARCHDHKFDPISMEDYYGLGGIFMSTQILETKSRIGAHRLKLKTGAGDTIGIREGGHDNSRHKGIGDMHIYVRGDPHVLGPRTPRRFPVILAGEHQETIGKRTQQSGRLELARWIASPGNPLTARVMANRLWQHHFGRGLVPTPSNFGMSGEPPSHPGLLDYLANQLVAAGWSLKAMHRLIMNSATYQQSTTGHESTVNADPENVLLGRFTPRRLSAEEIHDALLAVSATLENKLGHGKGNRAVYERSGYLHPSTIGSLFDAPATGTMVPRRDESTTAPQSLYLMNDEAVIHASRAFAERLDRTGGSEATGVVEQAYQLAYARPAQPREIEAGRAFLETLAPDQRWTYFQVLLCASEFIYLD